QGSLQGAAGLSDRSGQRDGGADLLSPERGLSAGRLHWRGDDGPAARRRRGDLGRRSDRRNVEFRPRGVALLRLGRLRCGRQGRSRRDLRPDARGTLLSPPRGRGAAERRGDQTFGGDRTRQLHGRDRLEHALGRREISRSCAPHCALGRGAVPHWVRGARRRLCRGRAPRRLCRIPYQRLGLPGRNPARSRSGRLRQRFLERGGTDQGQSAHRLRPGRQGGADLGRCDRGDHPVSAIELGRGPAGATNALLGAEARSWRVGGRDLLWPGDPAIWADISPILYPVVGWTRDGARVGGRQYALGLHGFARFEAFAVEAAEPDFVRLVLSDNERTRAVYPFAFALAVEYRLSEDALGMALEIANPGGEPAP